MSTSLLRAGFVCVAVIGHSAHAAEWFVSPLGNDSTGNGSMASPFRTLSHTLDPVNDIVTAGDTVTLRGPVGNNVYDECEVRLRVSLTLRSFAGETAHIRCDLNVADSVAIQIDPDAGGSRLSGLEISGSALYGVFFQTDWDSASNLGGRGPTNSIVEDCHIHDTGRDAIKITPKSDGIVIRRNHIHHTGAIYPPGTDFFDKNAEGIDNVNGSRMLVEDNHIHDTATSGVYFKGGAMNVIVQRNLVERTGESGILVGYDTSPEFFDTALNPNYYEAIRGIVRNNVVRDTDYAGIGLYAAQDALVANNTIINTARVGYAALYFGVTLQDFDPTAGQPPSVNPRLLNNLVIQNGGDCAGIRWANEEIRPGQVGLSGLQGNPGSDYNWFHNTAGPCNFFDGRPGSAIEDAGTFAQWRVQESADANSLSGNISVLTDGHLPAGSAAIDAGAVVIEVSDDFDTEARRVPYDIGADEVDAITVFRHGFESP